LASAAAANRQTGRAVEAMERAVANGFRNRERVERDPLFDGVRKDARFAALVEKIGK